MQPNQELYLDEDGKLTFKENKIVSYLLEYGGIDLNHLRGIEFPQNDREQFAQLIGYPHSGYGELSYVSDESYNQTKKEYNETKSTDKSIEVINIIEIRSGFIFSIKSFKLEDLSEAKEYFIMKIEKEFEIMLDDDNIEFILNEEEYMEDGSGFKLMTSLKD